MPEGEILILGSGTSTGVPIIGCNCRVCLSDDPYNNRTRVSILVRTNTTAVVVDTSVDFRQQMLRHKISRLDAILYTHSHADHLHGLDDVRPLCNDETGALREMPCYGYPETLRDIRHRFAYAFKDFNVPTYKPALKPVEFPGKEFKIGDIHIRVVRVIHGDMPVAAFLFWDRYLYATDLNFIPEESSPMFENLDTIIIGAPLMRKHPTHFSIPEALDVLRKYKPRQGFVTHLSHVVDHREFEKSLEGENIKPAYDGLRIPLRIAQKAPGL